VVPAPIHDPKGAFLGVVGTFLRATCVPARLGAAPGEELRRSLGEITAELERAAAPAEAAGTHAVLARLDAHCRVPLTARERTIVSHVARGDRVANVAEALGIRPVTVRNHLKSVFRKTGVHSQQELGALLRGAPPR
jgi:DNA-binding CsgD family transcriptional regulator